MKHVEGAKLVEEFIEWLQGQQIYLMHPEPEGYDNYPVVEDKVEMSMRFMRDRRRR